jgi:hypothetical protein
MPRRVLLAGVLALVAWATLIGLGAVIVTAGTGTLDGRATGWVAVNLVAALVAGFAASRACVGAPAWARYAAALTGPVLLSLEFTLTTNTDGPVWLATVATAVGAGLGCAARDAVGRASASPRPRSRPG